MYSDSDYDLSQLTAYQHGNFIWRQWLDRRAIAVQIAVQILAAVVEHHVRSRTG